MPCGNDLRRFLDCTNYKKGFQTIRSISLAYYSNKDLPGDHFGANKGQLDTMATIVMVLKLLPHRPYYSLTLDHASSFEDRDNKLRPALYHMEAVVRSFLDPEGGPKKFCRSVVWEIALSFVQWCPIYQIGELEYLDSCWILAEILSGFEVWW